MSIEHLDAYRPHVNFYLEKEVVTVSVKTLEKIAIGKVDFLEEFDCEADEVARILVREWLEMKGIIK